MSVTTTRIPDKSTRPPDVTKLSGYSGDVTKFLRDDATFVVPPGGGAGSGMNLDYLGDFVAGPVYNDGDIVIGADGIAYMCVVDGTVTPPDPWPGLGMVTTVGPPGPPGPQGIQGPPGNDGADGADGEDGPIDPTYWVVAGHPTLTNERALNTLANGYVKSTGGEPSTVAVIPVSEGGTSATNATSARTNLGVGNVGTFNTNGDPTMFLRGDGVWAVPPTAASFPSGLIAISVTPCPPGWTRVGWDGYFVRGGATPNTVGGADSHSHSLGNMQVPNHEHDSGTLRAAQHKHNDQISISISGNTSNVGDHRHYFAKSVTVSGRTGDSGQEYFDYDHGGSSRPVVAVHSHQVDLGVLVDGDTDDRGGHQHSFSGSGSGSIGNDDPKVNGVTGQAGATAIQGGMDGAPNVPLHVNVFFCIKN